MQEREVLRDNEREGKKISNREKYYRKREKVREERGIGGV